VFRVEFFGPMGAGKSTLERALLKKKSLKNIIILSQQKALKGKLLPTVSEKLLFSLHGKTVSGVIAKRARKHFGDLSYVHTQLVRTALESLLIEKSVNFDTLFHFHDFIEDLSQLIYLERVSNHDANKIFIQHEGLIQRGVGFAMRCPNFRQGRFFKQYFESVPRADLIVYVNATKQVCAKRLSVRDGVHARLSFLDEAFLSSAEASLILKSVGANVLNISTQNCLQSNLNLLVTEIRKLAR
jgi:ABC-type cobalamin/Fe3+-siderophores transport system ATPase subunit